MNEAKGQAVVVTTQHRGVFFGYLVGEPSKEKVMVTGLRNCVYWSADVKGVFGLASVGPSASCKVGLSVPGQSTLFDVTGVYTCTDEAAKKWEDGAWAR